MNATSAKKHKKCKNIHKIKEWCDCWLRTYQLTVKYIGSFSHPRAKEVHHVQHLVLVHLFFYINLVFDPGEFRQDLLEFTVLEEIFSYRTPCSLLFH